MSIIEIPEGMIRAAEQAYSDTGKIKRSVEAALRWQSENPPVPTEEQAQSIRKEVYFYPGDHRALMAKWVRRMYLAPEPELVWYRKVGDEYIPFTPDAETDATEAVKDLLVSDKPMYDDSFGVCPPIPFGKFPTAIVNAMIIRAYRRGKEDR